MAYNLFIAYDLVDPGQNYSAVTDAIKSLGDHAHLQQSFFYVQSRVTMEVAHSRVRAAMDRNDRLAVVLAEDAFISNYQTRFLDLLSKVFTQTHLLP